MVPCLGCVRLEVGEPPLTLALLNLLLLLANLTLSFPRRTMVLPYNLFRIKILDVPSDPKEDWRN
jgi:hypothetical protein